jgi:hypothetical protein
MNGIFGILERGRDILREKYREDLFPRRTFNREYPGRKLTILLAETLAKFPKNRDGQRFRRLSDLSVLGGNALISLHIIRSAQIATQRPQFVEYYRTNLFTQDALLKAALEWYGFDEELLRMTSGNAAADRARRGYLTLLSLWSLASRETNPFMKEKYMTLIGRAWTYERHEDNPLSRAIWMDLTGKTGDAPFLLRALDQFQEDRLGYGEDYWKAHGDEIAKKWAGGVHEGYSREPLPWALRPKDAFLCQRSARRLRGDRVMKYPPTDFLFVYWFARHHRLISAPKAKPIAATSEPR